MSVLSNRVVFNDEWDDIQKDPLFEKEISKRVGVIVKDGMNFERGVGMSLILIGGCMGYIKFLILRL